MIEIERKFLVISNEYKSAPSRHIRQGYVCSSENRAVRIRIIDNRAVVTLKNATIGFARNEYEYPIPLSDAEEMLNTMCRQPIIDKTRYFFEYAGHTWEIDVFHGNHEGLVIAEIELEHMTDSFEKPSFVGEEVTGNPNYYNSNL